MIHRIDKKVIQIISNEEFRSLVVKKLNEIIVAINTGPVWENRVEAQRQVEEVYTSLPVSVVAEMVEQDYTNTMQEIGLEAIQ